MKCKSKQTDKEGLKHLCGLKQKHKGEHVCGIYPFGVGFFCSHTWKTKKVKKVKK